MKAFDPNGVGEKGNIFGYPFSTEEADLVLIPVPWDVTTSYQDGTSKAPELIRSESTQLDYSIPTIKNAYDYPVAMTPLNKELLQRSFNLRSIARDLILKLEKGEELTEVEENRWEDVNQGCVEMTDWVKNESLEFMAKGKIVGVVGGDHSTPLGLIQALDDLHDDFGILQIDAHMDLRESYEGFTYSHASIMSNALKNQCVSRLIQVGTRDYCEEEKNAVAKSNRMIITHFDETLNRERWGGISWQSQAQRIVNDLPHKVYVSFDMDGLEPSLCPNTGTPVPGGLDFYDAVFLIEEVVRSGRELIGFDVSETGDSVWDANVASRILFRLCASTGISRGRLSFI